jgi:hypothetical protein
MIPDDAEGGRAVFAELIRELLAAEDERRESLEARGGSVITVSGALVTLLLGLAALATKEKSFTLPEAARDRLSIAVFAFVLAALLSTLLPTIWDRGTDFALKKATATRLEQLATTQTANDRKARALLGAVAAQVVAVLLLAWAVLALL